MTKKKIKVLDIIPESNENDTINDDVEAVKETESVIETETKSEEKVEEIVTEPTQEKQEPIQETPTEIIDKEEETTKTREQQLRQCPKCQKWLTPKTLKYFHECTKNDTVKAKRRPHKKVIEVKKNDDERPTFSEDIEDTPPMVQPPPMPVKLMRQTNQIVEQGEKFLKSINTDKIDYKPPVEVSYEDMRRERIKQRIQQRSIKMTSLFANAI